jgi:hypothetical protein
MEENYENSEDPLNSMIFKEEPVEEEEYLIDFVDSSGHVKKEEYDDDDEIQKMEPNAPRKSTRMKKRPNQFRVNTFKNPKNKPVKSKPKIVIPPREPTKEEIKAEKKRLKRLEKRKNRMCYDEKNMKLAYEAVNGEQKMSLGQASKKFGVPRSSLHNRLKRGLEIPMGNYKFKLLPDGLEDRLIEWLQEGTARGDFKRKYEIFYTVPRLRAGKDIPRKILSPSGLPTQSWFKRLCNKQDFKFRTNNPIDYPQFFTIFRNYLSEKNFTEALTRPDAWYIIEDAEFEMSFGIVNDRRARLKRALFYHRTEDISPTLKPKDSITVTYCFCANGDVLQQLLLFRCDFDKMYDVAKTDAELKSRFLFAQTRDGTHTRISIHSYLQRLEHQLKDVERPIFVFVSETIAHAGIEIFDWCKEKQIYVFSFIPRNVSILGNCDKGYFGVYNEKWREDVESYQRDHKLDKITEVEFLKILTEVNRKVLDRKAIVNGFEESGIFPFTDEAANETDEDEKGESEINYGDPIENFVELEQQKSKTEAELIAHMKKIAQKLENIYQLAEKSDNLLCAQIIQQQLSMMEANVEPQINQ